MRQIKEREGSHLSSTMCEQVLLQINEFLVDFGASGDTGVIDGYTVWKENGSEGKRQGRFISE
jgi:hypothetical protein